MNIRFSGTHFIYPDRLNVAQFTKLKSLINGASVTETKQYPLLTKVVTGAGFNEQDKAIMDFASKNLTKTDEYAFTTQTSNNGADVDKVSEGLGTLE